MNMKPKGVMKAEEVMCSGAGGGGTGGGTGGGGSMIMATGRGASPPVPNIRHNPEDSTFDIPIFTEEFLDHNKGMIASLRKSSSLWP